MVAVDREVLSILDSEASGGMTDKTRDLETASRRDASGRYWSVRGRLLCGTSACGRNVSQ